MGAGLLLAPALLRSSALRDAAPDVPQIVLPGEATLIVRPAPATGALLRGQIQLVADAAGRAPIAGEVARQLAAPGTRVKRGDAVLEISSGVASRPAPAAERQQSAAEQSQIAAANEQAALAGRAAIAQAQLHSAQERVDRAQAQVGTARDIVRRLQNGEAVAPSELPPSFRPQRERVRLRRVAAPAIITTSRAAAIALQQAQAAREAARDGAQALQSARDTLGDAQKSVRETADRARTTAQTVTDVETRFDQKKASGADVEAARAAQKEAQSDADAASKAVAGAKVELAAREKSAASLEKYAEQAGDEAARLGAPRPTPVSAPTASATVAPARVTLEQAARFAGAALDESRRASRNAERIRASIDAYQQRVTTSRTEIETTSRNLASAQQKVLDSVPRARFTTAVAPADGVVTWVSRLAREVGRGDSVFGLASGGKINARFQDSSGLWRGLKAGAVLTAFVTAPPKAPAATIAEAGATASTTATPVAPGTPAPVVSKPGAGTTSAVPDDAQMVTVHLREVQTPAAPGAAATLSGEVQLTSGAATQPLRAGAVVMASVPRPGAKPTLSVPVGALLQRDNATYLAVLLPIAPSPAPSSAAPKDSASNSASSNSASANDSEPSAAQNATAPGQFRLHWQRVQLGAGDGLRQEIVAGLAPGTRIVAQSGELEAMQLAPALANPVGNPGAAPASGEKPRADATPAASALPAEVVVRLTAPIA